MIAVLVLVTALASGAVLLYFSTVYVVALLGSVIADIATQLGALL